MKENLIKDKSFCFAIRIVNLYKYLNNEKKEFILSKQILRSGTAIGALVREAEHGQSKADFIHKLSISLKEANETDYWIDLLYKTNYLEEKQYKNIKKDITELLKILTSIIKTSKGNYQLSIINYQLSIINYQLSIINYAQSNHNPSQSVLYLC